MDLNCVIRARSKCALFSERRVHLLFRVFFWDRGRRQTKWNQPVLRVPYFETTPYGSTRQQASMKRDTSNNVLSLDFMLQPVSKWVFDEFEHTAKKGFCIQQDMCLTCSRVCCKGIPLGFPLQKMQTAGRFNGCVCVCQIRVFENLAWWCSLWLPFQLRLKKGTLNNTINSGHPDLGNIGGDGETTCLCSAGNKEMNFGIALQENHREWFIGGHFLIPC